MEVGVILHHALDIDRGTIAVGEGSHHVLYNASDSARPAVTQAAHDAGYVNIDKSAPETTISGVPSGWTNRDVTVTLIARDGFSGIASREYRLGSGDWLPYAAPIVVRTEGETVVACRASDVAGNTSLEATATVHLDKTGPTTIALGKVKVQKGKRATFRFRVVDRTPMATVTVGILSGKKLIKTLSLGANPTGSAQSYVWKCTLAKGHYTWKVYATDLAGNEQRTIGWRALTVK